MVYVFDGEINCVLLNDSLKKYSPEFIKKLSEFCIENRMNESYGKRDREIINETYDILCSENDRRNLVEVLFRSIKEDLQNADFIKSKIKRLRKLLKREYEVLVKSIHDGDSCDYQKNRLSEVSYYLFFCNELMKNNTNPNPKGR